MATLTKQPSGRWRAQVRRVGRRALSATFPTKPAAQSWARKVEAEIAAGADPSTRTLARAIDTYLDTQTGQRLNRYERAVLAWWRRRLGDRRIQELKRGDFYDARSAMRGAQGQPLAAATLNRRVSMVAAVLSHVMHMDWIAANPARIRRLAEDNLIERPVDPDEIRRLLDACRASSEPHLYALVLTAMCSGARAGELQRLTWRDVNLETGMAGLLKTKSGRRRGIPIQGIALEELRRLAAEHAKAGGDVGANVFQHADGRAPFAYPRSWRAARRAAGVEDLRFHDLRHLAASTLAVDGASQRDLMVLLGHANPATTARYAHLTDDHVADLGGRLVRRLFPDWQPGQDGQTPVGRGGAS